MELAPTDDQRMLADSLNSLLEKRYDSNARLRLLDEPELGWSRELWSQYAQLGLLGLTFDSQYGGEGMGVAEQAVVMEAFGRALILEPFFATVVLGGALVASAGTSAQKQEILPMVVAGDLLLAFAGGEVNSRWSQSAITTRAVPSGGGWTLDGEKSSVLGGDVADRFIVSALTPAGTVGLFLVEGRDVVRRAYRMHDGLGGADVSLRACSAIALGKPAEALRHIESVLTAATALLCAEAVGAMERMLWLTVDYLKTRVQFGQPIARLQALQFRAADMYVALEEAKSMAILARLAFKDADVVERYRLVCAAKTQIDGSARKIGQEAVQLHGGVGMTMEFAVGHYLKRTATIAKIFADHDKLIDVVAAGPGLIRVN